MAKKKWRFPWKQTLRMNKFLSSKYRILWSIAIFDDEVAE
jgi:hypothetical protein